MERARQETLPDMELVSVIEQMSVEERLEHKSRYLSEISDREMLCRLIDEVNHVETGTVPSL